MTGPSLRSRDAAAPSHPFTPAGDDPPLPVVAAEGSWLVLEDGRRVLDGISSWWTNLHGHSHPRIAAAIAEQAARLDHVLFAGCTHPAAVDVAERLLRIAPPGLARVFFSDDGSTAVEVALKIAFQHWANRGEERSRFVALEHGYHGDTVGAMSAGDPAVFDSPFRPILFPVERVPAGSPDALRAVLEADPRGIAAVIVEPMVQGAGGMRFHDAGYLRAVADLCREHGVPWIADEVMTAFGRTGRMFAVEHAGVSPDILCLAKGLTGGALPLAATLVSEAVEAPFRDPDRRKAFLHGHSYTANPIACAAARANLEVLEEEPVFDRIAAIEARWREGLPALRDLPGVADVRWLGTIGVVELAGEAGWFADLGPRLRAAFLRRGVLLRPLGPVVYAMPPYSATSGEMDLLLGSLADVLREVGRGMPRT